MRVVFFSKGGPDVPSSRYRCYRVAEELERQGVEARVCDPPPRRFGLRIPRGGLAELWRLHRELARVRRSDVLYLQRPTHNTLFVWLAVLHKRLRRLTMVFDFCDPLWVHAPFKTRFLTRNADLVVASCEDLAVWARQHSDNVHVIPNSVLPSEIAAAPVDHGNAPPVVGWVGAAKLHTANLEILLAPFAEVAARTPFTFRLVGTRGAENLVARFASIQGLTVDAIDWVQPEDVPKVIRSFDLAVLPLEDIEWNRKLVTKLVEYMAAGVPVATSGVGETILGLSSTEAVVLAQSTDEWVGCLLELLPDRQRRNEVARSGLAQVGAVFSLPNNAAHLRALLKAVLAARF